MVNTHLSVACCPYLIVRTVAVILVQLQACYECQLILLSIIVLYIMLMRTAYIHIVNMFHYRTH